MKGTANTPGSSSPILNKIRGLFVPVTRTINGKPLDADIKLTAEDVGVKKIEAIEETAITSLFDE